MRFALLGDHPDGMETAAALAATGRYQLVAFTGAAPGPWAAGARRIADLEEVLADPAVEAVIVAGKPAVRPAQLRRALQSERHVLCVHPPDDTPEIAYEAAMLRDDVRVVLLPILAGGLHPAVRRLANFVGRSGGNGTASPIGAFRLLDIEWAAPAEVLEGVAAGRKPTFPGWDVLRALGGEVAEVAGFAEAEEIEPGSVVLLAGRFEAGGLFRVAFLPGRGSAERRLSVLGAAGRADLDFPQGDDGPAFLSWRDVGAALIEESWDRWDPWAAVVEQFDAALASLPTPLPPGAGAGKPQSPSPSYSGKRGGGEGAERQAAPPPSSPAPPHRGGEERTAPRLSWQDAVRALELDDAARRSVARRRADRLEYQEATEAVGFKGTMTLVGCGVLLVSLLLLILANWVPQAGWLIVPLLVVFLGLQLFRPLAGRSDTPPAARNGTR